MMYFLDQKKENKLSLEDWAEIVTALKVYVLSLWIRFKHSICNLEWAFMNISSESYLKDLRYFI